VAQLREVFAVGKKYAAYKDFKVKTFSHAVNEINSQYEMNLKFEEIKEGRRVVSIRFEFTSSSKAQGYNPATKQLVNITVKPKRKTKQDDDNAPPPVHPDQQELPLNQESTGQKILKTTAKGLSKLGIKPVPEVKKALDERKDNSVKETLKAVTKGAINADKRRIADVAKAAKILMDTMGISALEAYEIAEKKVKPI
jgi:plasmid replication initiation protein